jgi:hypothetical protein
MRALDLVGMRFGMLRVTACAQRRPVLWTCVCACGGTSTVSTGALRSGNSKSCGCRKREVLGESTVTHGYAGTRTHRIWKGMLTRCRNTNVKGAENYVLRGITVCKRWLKFVNFLADMGEAPVGHSLDRRDNNAGYSPDNCRWATREEQNRNARSNIKVKVGDETMVVAQWAARLGVSKGAVYARIKRGWSLEAACTVSPRAAVKGSGGKVLHIEET